MPGLAREGEELLMAAAGALETGESGGKVAAAVELIDHRHGIPAQRAMSPAMAGVVVGDELIPCMVNDLPERRCPGASWSVNGRHKYSVEHL
jgi:hypothetical protein